MPVGVLREDDHTVRIAEEGVHRHREAALAGTGAPFRRHLLDLGAQPWVDV